MKNYPEQESNQQYNKISIQQNQRKMVMLVTVSVKRFLLCMNITINLLVVLLTGIMLI